MIRVTGNLVESSITVINSCPTNVWDIHLGENVVNAGIGSIDTEFHSGGWLHPISNCSVYIADRSNNLVVTFP